MMLRIFADNSVKITGPSSQFFANEVNSSRWTIEQNRIIAYRIHKFAKKDYNLKKGERIISVGPEGYDRDLIEIAPSE